MIQVNLVSVSIVRRPECRRDVSAFWVYTASYIRIAWNNAELPGLTCYGKYSVLCTPPHDDGSLHLTFFSRRREA